MARCCDPLGCDDFFGPRFARQVAKRYPDYRRLLTAAAEHARRMVVFSHPPRNAASRRVVGAQTSPVA